MDDPNRAPLSEIIESTLSEIPGAVSFHDLRIVPGATHTNVIFDVVLEPDFRGQREDLCNILKERISGYDPSFQCLIEFDTNYIDTNKTYE